MITSHPSRKRNGVSKSRSRNGKRKRVPARSRRFSPAEHARALSLILDGIEREQIAKTIGCTTESLRRWYAEGKKQGLVTKVSKRESWGLVDLTTDQVNAARKVLLSPP